MYVCGITPYDATHIGHANTYVAFDVINRVWRDCGLEVRYVQNVTDIDDPLLVRAAETGQDWRAVADRETELFRADMAALGVIPPDHYIGAVEAIPSVVSYVERLLDSGDVYSVGDDLYFRVRKDPGFGSVAHLTDAQMREVFAERGGDPDRPGKEDPLDCLVWQRARPGEPSWETSLGAGRPGWHIECAAIALDHLGCPIDVQGGGSDLAFPHHEMGAAEAERITGHRPFARLYVHSGMVSWQGHKMSKSRGNLVFVSALRSDGVDPMALRLALLAHHYRSDWAWTTQGLVGAEQRLESWRQGAQRKSASPAEPLLAALRRHLADDLATPAAIDAVDAWVHRDGDDTEAPGLMARAVGALLGIRLD
jgi:L-cysteine:1D-myo-inositol 2-amino-2-deoxy-alpha-D-glucopyranoside ligase